MDFSVLSLPQFPKWTELTNHFNSVKLNASKRAQVKNLDFSISFDKKQASPKKMNDLYVV